METKQIKKTYMNKFTKNLFEASLHKTDINETKREWEIISEEKREDIDRLCICQHRIKNVVYLYNKHTKNIINCGVECKKKFGLEDTEKMKNGIMKDVLTQIMREKKTEDEKYEMRFSMEKYLPEIKQSLINHINKLLSNSNSDMNKLTDLRNKIKDLIDEYRMLGLDSTLEKIILTIDELKKRNEEERKRRIEEEKRLQILQEEERKKREEERIKKEEERIKEVKEKIVITEKYYWEDKYKELEDLKKRLNTKNQRLIELRKEMDSRLNLKKHENYIHYIEFNHTMRRIDEYFPRIQTEKVDLSIKEKEIQMEIENIDKLISDKKKEIYDIECDKKGEVKNILEKNELMIENEYIRYLSKRKELDNDEFKKLYVHVMMLKERSLQ